MSGHFLNLKEAAIVATEQLLDAQAMISEAVEAQAMVAIHGAAGTGKSFAVEQALIDLRPAAGSGWTSAAVQRFVTCVTPCIARPGSAPSWRPMPSASTWRSRPRSRTVPVWSSSMRRSG